MIWDTVDTVVAYSILLLIVLKIFIKLSSWWFIIPFLVGWIYNLFFTSKGGM
jgi:hypothetical protein